MRQERELNSGALRVPYPVIVAGDHPEAIGAGRQFGIVSDATIVGVYPLAIVAFQPILELHTLRNQQARRRIVEFNLLIAGRYLKAPVGPKSLPIRHDLFQNHGGHQLIAYETVRGHPNDSFVRGEPERAVMRFTTGGLQLRDRGFGGSHAIGRVVSDGVKRFDFAAIQVIQFLAADGKEAAARAHPEITPMISQHIGDLVVEQPFPTGIAGHMAIPDAKSSQPRDFSAEPEAPFAVIMDGGDPKGDLRLYGSVGRRASGKSI